MEIFLKRCCKLMFKFDVYFRNIEVINNLYLENANNLFC